MTNLRSESYYAVAGKNILVCIGGGIAAYKVCGLISQLFQRGANVKVLLTDSAQKFITPLSVSTLSRQPAYTDSDFWQANNSPPLHIDLGEWADLMVIAPLTANTLGKLVYGLADNLLTNTVLASNCPILVAPAMNTQMWLQQSVQNNWLQLSNNDRYHLLHTNSGLLACDQVGKGRMAEPIEILLAIESIICSQGKKDLQGKNILISAGSTREYLDAVRFLGNPATGKMGIALATACCHRGANVTLVAGNVASELLTNLPPCQVVPVVTAEEMEQVLVSNFPQADYLFMSAAVADVKPKEYFQGKLSKKSLPDRLELELVNDIVATLSKQKQDSQTIIGFAAQTGDIAPPALGKLNRKGLDAIVANPIDKKDAGFGSDTNQAIFIDRNQQQYPLASTSKLILSHQILDLIRLM